MGLVGRGANKMAAATVNNPANSAKLSANKLN